MPSANGAFIAKITNDTDTVGTAVGCTAYAQDATIGPAFFAYPLGDSTTSGGAVTDVSGNNNSGTYSATGVTGGITPVACPRDKETAVSLSGGGGNADTTTSAIYGPTSAQTNPSVYTEEIWFKAAAGASGKLIGFGSQRTGLSVFYDRQLYITSTGTLAYGVFPNAYRTVTTSTSYTDDKWHFAAATLSSAGMVLYFDGVKEGSDPNTTSGAAYTGYWRIGYDNLATWPGVANYHFTGQLAWASVYNSALTAAQIAKQYAAGT